MSSQSAGSVPQRRWLGNKGLLIACGVIGLVLIIAWFILTFLALRGVPTLAGGVTIKANPGVKIYVGERLFANGNVSLRWDELYREVTPAHLATEVVGNAVTAEALAGPGAQVLQQSVPSRTSTNILDFNECEYLLRRKDGNLDQVLVLLVDLRPPHDRPRRFFVPIRARQGGRGAPVFLGRNTTLSVTSKAAFLKLFGQSPSELSVSVTIRPATPPRELAQEIKENGLWEPSENPSGNQ
jgi:hypothetical protein